MDQYFFYIILFKLLEQQGSKIQYLKWLELLNKSSNFVAGSRRRSTHRIQQKQQKINEKELIVFYTLDKNKENLFLMVARRCCNTSSSEINRYFDSDLFCLPEILKRMFKPSFWVQNCLLNLCPRVVNSQSLFCSQNNGVKCSY